jgi:hypothetical protein
MVGSMQANERTSPVTPSLLSFCFLSFNRSYISTSEILKNSFIPDKKNQLFGFSTFISVINLLK